MSPTLQPRSPEPDRFPRVSGDEPAHGEAEARERVFSPRERG